MCTCPVWKPWKNLTVYQKITQMQSKNIFYDWWCFNAQKHTHNKNETMRYWYKKNMLIHRRVLTTDWYNLYLQWSLDGCLIKLFWKLLLWSVSCVFLDFENKEMPITIDLQSQTAIQDWQCKQGSQQMIYCNTVVIFNFNWHPFRRDGEISMMIFRLDEPGMTVMLQGNVC